MKKIFQLLLLFISCITTSCSKDNDDKEPTIGGISATCDQALVGTWMLTIKHWSDTDHRYLPTYYTYTFNSNGTGHYKVLSIQGINKKEHVSEHDFRWQTSQNELTIISQGVDNPVSTYKYSISENGRVLTMDGSKYELQ